MKNRNGTLIPLPRRPTKLDQRIREGTAQSHHGEVAAQRCWQNGAKMALAKRRSSNAGRTAQQRRWWNDATSAAMKPPPPRCSGGAAVVKSEQTVGA
ncbi:hypothetical protein DEO72_LG4g1192 [Vigna unguiculata]|uniref:Uncharacterized protein n=1 Tax=Vigna unguiculata TaxID=3917 RepID=A0A4D6LNW0_VIGUN|nr:hypothetical protein DEO72_LG4g1192 [Vigna unguiculata]